MSRKVEIPNLDDLGRRYLAGERLAELARECGVHEETLRNRLIASGIYNPGQAKHRPVFARRAAISNLDTLIERYLAGEPEQRLAAEAGVNRSTFRQRLLEAGIQPRNVSDSMFIRWENATPAERERMVANAHATMRGRTVPRAEKLAQARGKEAKLSHAVPVEFVLANHLRSRGLDVTLQKALDVYNIDVAVHAPPIAVEIFGGSWHASGEHGARFHQRAKDILDLGWTVVIVWVDGRRYPLSIACADYIVTLAEELSSDPAARRQYRVILGDGQPAPVAQSYLNTPADIERLGCG